MKVYLKNTNVVVDVEDVNKELQYIPIHNSKFVFVGDSVKIFDYTDEDESSFTDAIANLKNESGTLIGNKDQTATYLSEFIGSPALIDKNQATHQELTNPSSVVISDFKELSFACDGTIDVTINGVTIQYPKTMGGVTVLGETLKADLTSEYSVTFDGTGSVLVVLQK